MKGKMKREFPEAQHEDRRNGGFPAVHRPSPPPHLRLPSTEGSTIEAARRPRGRPPGSKNKPKPPSIVAQEDSSEPSMCPYVLEIPAGVDIIDSALSFCRRRNTALCVLNGNGAVSTVTLKQPTTAAALTFHGRFDILSISGTVLPAVVDGSFAIFLAGPQGQVVGGNAAGPLVAAGAVYLIAATFNTPSVFRLPTAGVEDPAAGDGGDDRHESSEGVYGRDGGGAPGYSYQPPDVIWTPTPRPAPPY